ncbi:hypothetical protein [Pedobacter caeni]|uniref:Lipoprotein n=1 Tax=Pedobacter caeni TaxID=288992 RepID=A0A1M5BBN4_9SPHI|nr:hypothetical protein [Pedobacter caeni]SHF39552.1 hypothetical protein SAMN04488522_1021108 [Pedobacter caeni]
MTRKRSLYGLLIVLIYGCQQAPSNNNEAKHQQQKHRSNYLMKYTDSTMQSYAETAYSGLVNHQYKFPSSTNFEQIINDVYLIDIKKSKFDDIDLVDDNGPIPIAIKHKNFIYIFDHMPEGEAIVNDSLTFHLNNYLFNKNTESRNSLLNSTNEQYLLDLVEKFGYTKDEYLLKYVLNKKHKKEESDQMGTTDE